ncbi:MAG: UDP-N-acetylmuramoyl-L-alanyl-D-glutamate--2,6-diaminopimelate ligase [Bacteroidota bacterium]|nr:UDP-N-acetylmuramoyl-L-alanyl-D-glutamate--2,6-diaminopimelate ligase [Bacteroidota bacterium]MDP4233975.1 UDP-N-acetylmuramoyl-L-alanyl-D-glutamate--2,6-diaminopimelate ligase [Bacteroidota bacterium]MDP4242774.1 UDP-N-acetylmuramoyl-L-alanyl-D-glutamate--2,6-diaminopimelate ligase [Bacteroidota bacterium]MDP4288488.1 UDP-N-acetylmuramoyl-L-alanyl-D-glutamate--2,6-diaminopimelate ligase [Bacteroidota bacterium]
MKFRELTRLEEIGLLEYYAPNGNVQGEADLSSPRYDSRDVRSGDVFFAIRGFETDGHRYIPQALARGARTIVLDDAHAFSNEDAEHAGATRILVENSRLALAVISEEAFGSPSEKLRLIGVTGTNGKTTTTSLIKQLLEQRGELVGLMGTVGIQIAGVEIEATHTTPESRDISELLGRMVASGVTTCVIEVSSHAVVLDRVAALDFDIAVFTNLTQDHLDFHHTMEEYFLAKQKFFNGLKDTAIAVTNADDPYGYRMVERTRANAHTFSIASDHHSAAGDLFATDLDLSIAGSNFRVQKRYSDESALIHSGLVGAFNVENLMSAIGALYFGVEDCSLATIATLTPSLGPVRGRFETISLAGGATAIIDYAHTPDALEHVLDTIRQLEPQARIITVFGCGGDRDRSKRPLMGQIAAERSDIVIITSDNPRSESPQEIIDEIFIGIPSISRKKVEMEMDRSLAINKAVIRAKSGDVILIAGKGHEQYQIIGQERHHFDDREEVLRMR